MANNITFRTLMLKGQAGETIESIEKISASGGVMRMRIHLSNGSHVDFDVNDVPDENLIDNRIDVKTADIRGAVESLTTIYNVTLRRADWVETATGARYVNTVTVQGIQKEDNLEILGFVPTDNYLSNEALKKELGYITYGVTGHNEIAFVCASDCPTLNLPLVLRKVVEMGA